MPASDVVFAVLCTASHWSQARACLASLRRHAPDVGLAFLAVDGFDPGERETLGAERLDPAECVDVEILAAMRARYSPMALSCALKPCLIGALLRRGTPIVHYVDADTLFFADPAPLTRFMAAHDVALTPHCLTPIPDDGYLPSMLTILRAGVHNAGYVGVANTEGGRAFVAWWADRLREHGQYAPADGLNHDQRWLDLAPSLFPGTGLQRHPGANVAYWNLHERIPTRRADGGYDVGGEPLLFYHFSGWSPREPERVSRHSQRHVAAPGSALAGILAHYADNVGPPADPEQRETTPVSAKAIGLWLRTVFARR